ncbi:MAG: hypothetical protein GX315_02350, partial [Spirochaetales bacterium]|nr:hypothetical protein [Spirochaetales bacterium]
MIIVLKQQISEKHKEAIRSFLVEKGYTVKEIIGQEETI